MEHETAIAERVAERYVLGELTVAEREAFEEHFFACTHCASLVRGVTAFADSATAMLRNQRQPAHLPVVSELPEPSYWMVCWLEAFRGPLVIGLACCFFLACGFIYFQQRQLAALGAPEALASVILISGTRGNAGPPTITIPPQARFFELVLDIPGEKQQSRSFKVLAPDHKVVSSGSVSTPSESEPLHLLLPYSAFHSGLYVVHLSAAGRPEPETYTFQIQRTEATK